MLDASNDGHVLTLATVGSIAVAAALFGAAPRGSASHLTRNRRLVNEPRRANLIDFILTRAGREPWTWCEAEDRLWKLDEDQLKEIVSRIREHGG